jgi:hypothetical protein
MINSPNESSFLNTLPGDPDKATQKILDKGFVKFAGGFDLNEVVLEAPCPGKFTTKMEQSSGTLCVIEELNRRDFPACFRTSPHGRIKKPPAGK